MLLYLSGFNASFKENVLCDASGSAIYEFKTRCLWKSESPAVPSITQTEILDSKNQKVIATIEWDGERPTYMDFGAGDERVVSDMFLPVVLVPGKLVFQTPSALRWDLTPKSMTLQADNARSLARYHPNSRLSSDGKLESVSTGAKSRHAKDWFEINVLEYGTLPIAEMLVDFIILESFRRLYFSLPDPTPAPPTPTPSLSKFRQTVF